LSRAKKEGAIGAFFWVILQLLACDAWGWGQSVSTGAAGACADTVDIVNFATYIVVVKNINNIVKDLLSNSCINACH
jgi:hypothetical protein